MIRGFFLHPHHHPRIRAAEAREQCTISGVSLEERLLSLDGPLAAKAAAGSLLAMSGLAAAIAFAGDIAAPASPANPAPLEPLCGAVQPHLPQSVLPETPLTLLWPNPNQETMNLPGFLPQPIRPYSEEDMEGNDWACSRGYGNSKR